VICNVIKLPMFNVPWSSFYISFIQLFSLAMLLVYVHSHLQKQISRIIFKLV
jgi:hypothetical protein